MSENDEITGRQIAAARALAGITQVELAKASKVSILILGQIETTKGPAVGTRGSITAVRRALEAGGIEFLTGNEPGVKLRKGG